MRKAKNVIFCSFFSLCLQFFKVFIFSTYVRTHTHTRAHYTHILNFEMYVYSYQALSSLCARYEFYYVSETAISSFPPTCMCLWTQRKVKWSIAIINLHFFFYFFLHLFGRQAKRVDDSKREYNNSTSFVQQQQQQQQSIRNTPKREYKARS